MKKSKSRLKSKLKSRFKKTTRSKSRSKSKYMKTKKKRRGGSKTLSEINTNTYGIITSFLESNNISKMNRTSKTMQTKTNPILKKQRPLLEAKKKLNSILIVSDIRKLIKKEDFDGINLSEESVLLDVLEYPLYDMVKCIWNEDGNPNNTESNNNNNNNNGIRSEDYYFCVNKLFNFQGETGEDMYLLIDSDENSIVETEDIYLMKHFYPKQHLNSKYSKIKYVIKVMNDGNNEGKLDKLIHKIKTFQSKATLQNYKEKYEEIVDDVFDIGLYVFKNTKNNEGFEMLATFFSGDSVIEKEVFY